MFENLKSVKERFDFLTEEIAKPEVISDNLNWKKLVKERSQIEDIVNCYVSYLNLNSELDSLNKSLMLEKDQEMALLFREEIEDVTKKIELKTEQLNELLIPKDENDESNVIMEIRPAAGGDEAALFAGVLFKMYTRYAERRGFKVEVSDLTETELGGIKEVSFLIVGRGAYSRLKFESGVHRVQRVPETETQGRVHTSTCTVAVLPEVEEIDVEILDKDLKIDTYRSSGAGGQHVNKTESAIRITHLPTNIVVCCQDERSQIKNRERAMSILRSKLYDFYKSQADTKYSENRKQQVGTGDRSERIRTYNYPQGRITDHRINMSVHNFNEFLDGNIDEMIEGLLAEDRKLKLEQHN